MWNNIVLYSFMAFYIFQTWFVVYYRRVKMKMPLTPFELSMWACGLVTGMVIGYVVFEVLT